MTRAVRAGTGALGAIAGTIEITPEMRTVGARGDRIAADVIRRAHDADVLRADVDGVDIALLIEQLGRSPLVEQITRQGRTHLLGAAEHARTRIVLVCLDGLRAPARTPLPQPQPGWELFAERWNLDPPT